MDLTPSPEQLQRLDEVRALLAEVSTIAEVRAGTARRSSIDRETWVRLGAAGCFGSDPLVDAALLLLEAGRHLLPGPVVPTIVAAHVARLGGATELGSAILAGTAPVGLAIANGHDWLLVDTAGCGWVVTVEPDGAALLPLTAFSDLTERAALDPTSRIATATLTGDPTASVAGPAPWRRGVTLTSAMLAGIALELAAPGSDAWVQAEAARAVVTVAALSVDEADRDAPLQVLSARISAAEAAHEALAAVLGDAAPEDDVHLYLTRTMLLERTFGTTPEHAVALAAMPQLLW